MAFFIYHISSCYDQYCEVNIFVIRAFSGPKIKLVHKSEEIKLILAFSFFPQSLFGFLQLTWDRLINVDMKTIIYKFNHRNVVIL